MEFVEELQTILETAEDDSVGTSFGGTGNTKSFSVAKIREWIISQAPYSGTSGVETALNHLYNTLTKRMFSIVVANLLRFSFLIELTDLKVGSTKMKTRWLSGQISVSEKGSFKTVHGTFQPGSDPRAATYEECLTIFTTCCISLRTEIKADPSLVTFISELSSLTRVPYEFPFGYTDPLLEPVHSATNIVWILNEDIRWLIKARGIFNKVAQPERKALEAIEKSKLEVKVYKTDRSLTGKDKTNRAKRWEVLAGDFQHATQEECWSVERKLTEDLVRFEDFPISIQDEFLNQDLIKSRTSVTRCPITLAPLNYIAFSNAVLNAIHGRSDYQIGHLKPLKHGGSHTGSNICWQSADGNRIQGDLNIEEVEKLLDDIVKRRQELTGKSTAVS